MRIPVRILLKQALFHTPSLLSFTLAQMTWKWHKSPRVDVSFFLFCASKKRNKTRMHVEKTVRLHWQLIRRNAQLNWWLNLLYRNQKYPSSKALISQLARNDDKVSLCSQIYKKLSSLIFTGKQKQYHSRLLWHQAHIQRKKIGL